MFIAQAFEYCLRYAAMHGVQSVITLSRLPYSSLLGHGRHGLVEEFGHFLLRDLGRIRGGRGRSRTRSWNCYFTDPALDFSQKLGILYGSSLLFPEITTSRFLNSPDSLTRFITRLITGFIAGSSGRRAGKMGGDGYGVLQLYGF